MGIAVGLTFINGDVFGRFKQAQKIIDTDVMKFKPRRGNHLF
jgi:hypothetical protein